MPAQGATLRVEGYRDFLVACDKAGKETKREVRGTFRKVGDIVKVDASRRLADISLRSAAGYRTYVRQRGVEVDQSLRRTPRKKPDWSFTQMRRALGPSLASNEERVVGEFERAMDTVCDHFERG